ncbi:hypothetical protein J2W15_001281 [Pseudarthrobacter sulfonivorans]|nr:hypothetical protein [Pseudarthrobacter sulfonivorans]
MRRITGCGADQNRRCDGEISDLRRQDSGAGPDPQIKIAVDQLAVTKVQDNARAFLPGADQEMAKAAAKILTQQADVKATMTELKKTLEGIYTKDVKPKLKA